MTLHEAIVEILKEEKKPLSIKSIVNKINTNDQYSRRDEKPLNNGQVRARIKKYPKLFDYINGLVILVNDNKWRTLLNTYKYLADSLRDHFNKSDLQFILAALIFIKRIDDTENNEYKEISFLDLAKNLLYGRINNESNIFLNEFRRFDTIRELPNIFYDCGELLSRITIEKVEDIFHAIDRLETQTYTKEEFGPIFEYLLHLISAEFSNSTIPYTPKYLQELMVSLLAPKKDKMLYDPASGSGGLLVEALKATNGVLKAEGTEINYRMVQLGSMNLIMNGFNHVRIKQEDCMKELYTPDRFDYIIADLPINGFNNDSGNDWLYNKWGILPSKKGGGYISPVLFVLSKLAETGKAVITVSESLLFKGGKEQEVRTILINNDLIESVISLPHGALKPYTTAKASILVLNKLKPADRWGKIRFIESVTNDEDEKEIDIEQLTNSHIHNHEQNKALRIVSVDELRKDFNLSASIYKAETLEVNRMLQEGKAKKLGELVNIKSGVSPKSEDIAAGGGVPLIKMENLSKDILDFYLNVNSAKQQVLYTHDYGRALLSTNALLVARIGDHLKTTYFKHEDAPLGIVFHSSILALVPFDENSIDLEYLYYQLNSELVATQVAQRRAGAVMPHISIAQLKEVIIPYVSRELQIQYVNAQKASTIAEARSKTEERIKALDYKKEAEEKESDVVRTLVHELRPKLSKLDVLAEKLNRIIEKHNLSGKKEYPENISEQIDPELSDLIEKPENFTLGEVVNKLSSDAKQLNEILTTVKEVMSFELNLQDFEQKDLLLFIENYITAKKADIGNKYVVEVKGATIMMEMHAESMTHVLDQLLANAEMHAFKTPSLKNKIIFNVRQDKNRGVAIIEYQNNGAPFLLTQREYVNFITKGKNSDGTGIGGFYINRIIKAHQGQLLIKEEQNSKGLFMTIEIPLKQTYE